MPRASRSGPTGLCRIGRRPTVQRPRPSSVHGLHRDDGMRRRSLPAVAFAVLCASSGAARLAAAQVQPPDWEPGCSPVPLGCMAGTGKLKLDVARRTLAWKWTDGGGVEIADVDKPTVSERYDFCVYDASNTLVLATGVPPAGTCSGRPCWQARSWGFLYRDRAGSIGGLTKIVLKVASPRHDRFQVQAGGPALAMPASAPARPLVVQLVRTHVSTLLPQGCWTSTQP